MTDYKYEDFDKERDKDVYKHLLNLTIPDFFNGKSDDQKLEKQPNETEIAEQWGDKKNRIFVRRVLRYMFSDFYKSKKIDSLPNDKPGEKIDSLPSLSLGKLIFILSALEKSYKNKNKKLSKDDKNKAIRLMTQLLPDEQHQIELSQYPGEEILRRIVNVATHPFQGLSLSEINKLYNLVISKNFVADKKNNPEYLSKDEDFDVIIKDTINKYFENFNYGVNSQEESFQRVKREISRIEFQCGLKQLDLIRNENNQATQKKYFTSGFIRRLTYSVIENQILTDEFPIYLKYYNIEKIKTLPLYIESIDQPNGLLNSRLLEKEEEFESINGLERQFCYKVTVHFYVKVPDNYTSRFEFTNANINKFSIKENRLEFFEEISGIGSPITLIVAAIDRALFRDIPILKKYFYVPQEKITAIEISGNGNNSFLWSHTLVQLCKVSDLDNAIKGSYYRSSNDVPIHGEYCGFDLVEVSTKSALVARLRAIKQTGESPNQYLSQLYNRIEEDYAVRIGLEKINYYPFSLEAMKFFYCQTILDKNDFNLADNSSWSMVTYEAYLNITEAFLKEGLYKIAKKYLDVMDLHVKYYNNIISDLMKAKYYLCLFRYSYLADLADDECEFSDRQKAITSAFNHLQSAEDCLTLRIKKMNYIDEIQQTNFNPFCYIYSRIYEHRAKISMFFNAYTAQNSLFESIMQPIKLFEKARIYAAREGNADLYACNSSYQAWCYLRLAYYLTEENNINPDITFKSEDCINWAKKLIKHSKICYSPIGKRCYQEIKNHSGEIFFETPKARESHEEQNSTSSSMVESVAQLTDSTSQASSNVTYGLPSIQELYSFDKETSEICQKQQGYDNSILKIDSSLLRTIVRAEDSKSEYLFGPHSSIIIFGMGMLELCETQENEKIIEKLSLAKRYFNYSSILAEDGSKTSKEDNTFRIERNFDKNINRDFLPGDHVLRGLYLHRLTQFADLGLVFYVACEIIELLDKYSRENQKNLEDENENKIENIQKILDKLLNNHVENPENYLGQSRYNGHFSDHYLKLSKYFKEEIIAKHKIYCNRCPDIIKIRNLVVYDFFKIMSGFVV